ncbi:MAG: peptide deformylase [Candidatus Kapabacteria bacterium]|nr:peptide deformylase [Candidatus Kapabacteria bacterium]
MILPIYNCFHPVLKKSTEPITEINDELITLIDNMFDTLQRTDSGVGLAANQVGVSKSIIVIDLKKDDDNPNFVPIALINPVIEFFSDDQNEYNEGCLSVPEIYEKVYRPKGIQLSYFDRNMKEHKIEDDDFLSRVIQHEIDHLHGILFFERVSAIRRTLLKNKLRGIKKGDYEAEYDMILPDGKKFRGITKKKKKNRD